MTGSDIFKECAVKWLEPLADVSTLFRADSILDKSITGKVKMGKFEFNFMEMISFKLFLVIQQNVY